MNKMQIGLQMYTLREETAKDFVGTLNKVAELGYQGVEFAGYGNLEPQQLADVLKDLKLISIGSHVSLERLASHLDEEIEMNVAIGSKYITCPWLDDNLRSAQGVVEVMPILIEASSRLAEHGIQLAYHNHDFEFKVQAGDKLLFDAIYAETASEQLAMELDVCWVAYAGLDPVELIQKYAGRIPMIHLKDMRTNEDGSPLTVELGQGKVDLLSAIEACEAAKVEWLIVEQDFCQNPAFESIATSMNWLKQNYL